MKKRIILSFVTIIFLICAIRSAQSANFEKDEPKGRPQITCIHDINEFCGLYIGSSGRAEYAHGHRVR